MIEVELFGEEDLVDTDKELHLPGVEWLLIVKLHESILANLLLQIFCTFAGRKDSEVVGHGWFLCRIIFVIEVNGGWYIYTQSEWQQCTVPFVLTSNLCSLIRFCCLSCTALHLPWL